jgi:ubiquinone/menaquinone biosynthesis C-methylase UbiE
MPSAQDKTIDLYHTVMQINASAHLLRATREVGIFDELREGQRTLDDICQARYLNEEMTLLLMDSMVALGIIEKYGDDYALSHAARLLCEYDQDFGDSVWAPMVELMRGNAKREDIDDQDRRNRAAATQWVHTPAAIQAAEILDIGGENEPKGIAILDIGCGSAVWSCAMAHRDPESTVQAVDDEMMLDAARHTADSIGLGERFVTVAGDPLHHELENDSADLVLIAHRLFEHDDDQAMDLLRRAIGAAKPGGRVVAIDFFRGPTRPNLTESVEAMRLNLGTVTGRMRTLKEGQQMFRDAGLVNVQFTFLAASRANLGMAVGAKPSASD